MSEKEMEEEVVLDTTDQEENEIETSNQVEEATEEAGNEEEVVEVDEVAELKAQLEEEQNKYVRMLADFDNYKRRQLKMQEEQKKFRAQSLISNVLPVLDNLSRALQVEVSSEDAVSLKEGVQMIERDLLTALEGEGLQVIEATGQPFDPNFHQAVMTAPEEGVESNIVLEEFQKGYVLNDRVIRPSMVKVSE
ncbi:MAG TPA: nucleotide exchange factor GrpE [Savagea sp.]